MKHGPQRSPPFSVGNACGPRRPPHFEHSPLTTLTTLAFAIALGWSLFQVASGLGSLITTAVHGYDNGGDSFGVVGALVWKVGDHFVVFDQLVQGLIEFGVVLVVFLFVARSSRGSDVVKTRETPGYRGNSVSR
jgi:hypothetical protein